MIGDKKKTELYYFIQMDNWACFAVMFSTCFRRKLIYLFYSILFYSILSILIESWKVGLYTQGVKLAIADLITYATNFKLNHRAG